MFYFRSKTSSNGTIAEAFGQNERLKFEKHAAKLFAAKGIDASRRYDIRLGLYGKAVKHRSVLLKLKEEHFAFKLHLCINLNEKEDVDNCPECGQQQSSFEEYIAHVYTSHLSTQIPCCGERFEKVLDLRKHVWENHRKANYKRETVELKFEEMENYEEFFRKNNLWMYEKRLNISFNDLLSDALSIIQEFGRYYIFFWNCQDFAVWFLTYHGIPLQVIPYSGTDLVTGTLISARFVRLFLY